MRFRRVFVGVLAIGLATLLAGCGTTLPERAYKTGEAYNLAQSGANDYREIAKPSLEVDTKIHNAMMKASPLVKDLLVCAKEIVAAEEAPTVPDDAAALGLDADDVAEAKEEACEGLLSRANAAIELLNQSVDKT